MEKILLAAYLSILAAFITAAASIVKLVNEKESKTTDYRQSWTDSVRKSLSQLIASITLQANYLVSRIELAHRLQSVHFKKAQPEHEKAKDSLADYLSDQLAELDKSIRDNRQCIQQNYALTALHFKPHDEIFIKIEAKFEMAESLIKEMSKLTEEENDGERRVLRERISSIVSEITDTSRFILKTEWENVKKGEPAYRSTKNWSLYIGVAAFAVLLVSGIYMIAFSNATSLTSSTSQAVITAETAVKKNASEEVGSKK